MALGYWCLLCHWTHYELETVWIVLSSSIYALGLVPSYILRYDINTYEVILEILLQVIREMITNVQHVIWPQACYFFSQAFNVMTKVAKIWGMGYYLGESLKMV